MFGPTTLRYNETPIPKFRLGLRPLYNHNRVAASTLYPARCDPVCLGSDLRHVLDPSIPCSMMSRHEMYPYLLSVIGYPRCVNVTSISESSRLICNSFGQSVITVPVHLGALVTLNVFAGPYSEPCALKLCPVPLTPAPFSTVVAHILEYFIGV
jgi:hypothetical protein